MYNIRAKRDKPGLRPQHYHVIRAAAELCDAEVEGLAIGSKEIRFVPGEIKAKTLDIDIGTAGSIALLLQSLLLIAAHAPGPVRLNIRGGTDNKFAPTIDYVNHVILRALEKMGAHIDMEIMNHGFYPKGGGRVKVRVYPKHLREFVPDEEEVKRIHGISNASLELKQREVAERQAKAAARLLQEYEVDIEKKYWDTLSIGSSITLWCEERLLGADALGERGKTSEVVGKEAASKLLAEIQADANVDLHLADNLVPWIALYGGRFRTSHISLHTKTNIWLCEKMLNTSFKVTENEVEANPG